MRAYGPLLDLKMKDGNIHAVISPDSKDQFKKFIVSNFAHQQSGKEQKIQGVIGFSGIITGVAEGGHIHFNVSNLTLDLETWYRTHTRASMNTFYGIIRFIAWAEVGHKPKEEDMWWHIEDAIERYAPELKHPITGEMAKVRPGDPRLTTVQMSKMIQGVLNDLAQMDIPEYVMDAIGPDMKKLWESWYAWRYDELENDPLFPEELSMDWGNYCEDHPVCEFSGRGGTEEDPLERMHIVSGGSSPENYEEPWNWIRALHSIHQWQHQNGWLPLLKAYPHMKGKIMRARTLAKKKGLEVENELK